MSKRTHSQASGVFSSAFGFGVQATGDDSTAIGEKSAAAGPGSAALGVGGVGGAGGTASGMQSSALGTAALAAGDYSTALGSDASASAPRSIAVGYGATAGGESDGQDSAAFGSSARTDGMDALALSAYSEANASWSIAIGKGATAEEPHSMALGIDSSDTVADGVALGWKSVADREDTVSVGDAATGTFRQIVNVAAGTSANDAVNVSQLDAQTQDALQAADSYADTVSQQSLGEARSYTNQAIAHVTTDLSNFEQRTNTRFHQVDRRINQVGAASAAWAGLAQNTSGDGANNISVGVGAQGGQQAIAIGYRRTLGRHASFSFGGASAGGKHSVSAGVGFNW